MEEKKEKKPRGPRKTPIQHLEAERDKFAKQRDDVLAKLSAARAEVKTLEGSFGAIDAAFKALDSAVNTQKVSPAIPRDAHFKDT